MADYFGSNGVVATTDVVTITGGFQVVVGMLDGEQEAECQKILRGGENPRTRVVAKQINQPGAKPGAKAPAPDVEQVTEMPMEFDRYRDAVLLRGIRSWDLTENGQTAPIDAKHVKMIPGRDKNKIFLAIENLGADLTPEQEGE